MDFTKEELRRAYRTRSLAMHPDREGGSDGKFQRVTEANQVLSNEDAKAAYDLGDDFPRERQSDNGLGPYFREVQTKKYFPERFEFEPFGNEHLAHREWQLMVEEDRKAALK